ncbi:hypothetical protein cyc_01015 [Cyclospora cayetanensis]|uniref:Uncharacterized protein n=1 Tax=Cyclospora cayetanensis TaxID=88456 RepID=A0A1D3CWG7_9EIME|nr:hypothetical protein cyc_01015 [Cyclospora cayetanensis]
MSYGESRVSLLQQAFPHQNPHCIAAAAEGLRGSNLPVIDAVGLLLLLQVMHRRALQIYALYEQGPQKPLSHQFFIDILLGALSPAAAARATALEHTLKNQQRFVDLSFEDFGTLLLLASDDPLRALPLPEKVHPFYEGLLHETCALLPWQPEGQRPPSRKRSHDRAGARFFQWVTNKGTFYAGARVEDGFCY